MLSRLLDTYFTNKLLYLFKEWILIYNLELEVTFYPHKQVQVFLRREIWKHGRGIYILGFNKKDAIIYLLNQKETKDDFIKRVNDFRKENYNG